MPDRKIENEGDVMNDKKTLAIGILFQQFADGLHMPMWTVADTLMFPQVLVEHHMYEHNPLMPHNLRQIFANMGYNIPKDDPEATKEIFYNVDGSDAVIAFLVRKAKGEYRLTNGLMKAEGDHLINVCLPVVDDLFLDHLPKSSRELFDAAFGKMCEYNSEFREINLERFKAKILIDKMKRK